MFLYIWLKLKTYILTRLVEILLNDGLLSMSRNVLALAFLTVNSTWFLFYTMHKSKTLRLMRGKFSRLVRYYNFLIDFLNLAPNPVVYLSLTDTFMSSLDFNWSIPDGLIDSFRVTCLNLNMTGLSTSLSLSNSSRTATCANLVPLTTYKITVTSVKLVNSVAYESESTITGKTGN